MTGVLYPLPPGPARPLHNPAASVLGGWTITSYFGGRLDPLTGRPGNHGGMDIAGPGIYRQPFHSVLGGLVNQAWDPSGGGWWTNLWADDGSRWGYGHADAFADPDGPGPLRDLNGKWVPAGTLLGFIGSTGHSTGAHLHISWAPPPGRVYADPHDQLAAASAGGRFPGFTTPPAPPATVSPAPTTSAPASTPEDPMLLAIVYLPDKADRWVIGLGEHGWYAHHIDNPTQLSMIEARGVPTRPLASGDNDLDGLFHELTGI